MALVIPGVSVSIEGDNQTGKTTFLGTAPLPQVGFAFELGIERAFYGAKWELFKDLEIRVIKYDPKAKANKSLWAGADITIFELPKPIQTDPVRVSGMVALWDYFNERVGLVCFDPSVRTGWVDTMGDARRVKAEAHLETLQKSGRQDSNVRVQLQSVEYGKVNPAIKDIYINFANTGQNLIASHHLTDEYKEGPYGKNGEMERKPTGFRITDGLSTTYDNVDVALRFKGVNSTGEFHVEAEFRKCGFAPELKTTSLQDPTWDSLMNWMRLKLGGRLEFPVRNGVKHE